MHRLPELFHDLMNECQAVQGFLELEQTEKARKEMREVFKLLRRMRRVLDAEDLDKRKKP